MERTHQRHRNIEAPGMHTIVEKLVSLIHKNGWEGDFNLAIQTARAFEIPSIHDIKDLDDYLGYIDALVAWTPRERGDSRMINDKLLTFYFFLDQEPVKSLQSPIAPGRHAKNLTPLSAWIVEYANSWGSYLDTAESAKEVESFRSNPLFNWDEYMPPPSGFKTFNQFFARHAKPGMRPVAAASNDAILVAPADSSFVGWWQIGQKSKLYVEDSALSIKGMQWSIHQLLEGSAYADRFKGGIFTHSFLDTFDYHRWHAPVRGRVLEARVLQGQAYLEVGSESATINGTRRNVLADRDGTGYQFVQTRGLIVLESPIGLVACLPMGMAQVSSVVITAEAGMTLRKGEELGYFQFGGSDFVMVFERSSNVNLTCQPHVHVQQGSAIGTAFPA
jgi:phosphatidylserine decarboxylase